MSTEVAQRPTGGMGLISRDALKQSLGHVAAAMPKVATGGIDFAKMSKKGDWAYGQDETEVDYESIWAVNPSTLQHGWIAWKEKLGQDPIGEHMGSAMRPLIDVDTLPKVSEGKGWQQQYGVELVCVSGPNVGAHILYKNTTVGAIKLFNVYINELMTRVENDAEEIVALVRLTSESYKHKEFGETFNPIFEYVEWRSPEDASPVAAEEKAPASTPAKTDPAPRQRKPAPEPVAASDQAAADEDAEPVQEEGEDDDDFTIRLTLWKKAQKQKAAAAAPAEAANEATPRRRERRVAG